MPPRDQFQPLTAAEAYHLLNVEQLKALAKFVTHAVPGRKDDLVKLLERTMLGEGNLREYFDEQDEIGQAAIREATHHPQGRLDLQRFEAKYGQIPVFYQQREKEPDDYYYSFDRDRRPSKLRLFFPRGDAVPTDVAHLLRSLLPPPEPVKIPTLPELPAQVKPVWLQHNGYWAKGELAEQAPYLRLTAQPAQQEVKTLLRLAECGHLKVSEKTHKPSQAALEAIAKLLTDGDYYCPEDADDSATDPGADLTMKPLAWCLLVQAAGWASVTGGKLQLTDAGRKALHKPAPELLQHAWEKWQKTTVLDEFSRVSIIKGQQSKSGHVMSAVAPRRQVLTETLRRCPVGGWIAIDEFFRQVRLAPEPGLTLCHDPWRLYLFEQEYGSLGYDGHFSFETLEGRYIMAFLFEYAATLGLIDIAYIPPSGARNEFHERWGADNLSCLSRYDGLLYFRINPLGAWILGLAPEYVPEQVAEEKLLKVLPNRDIVADHTLPAGDALFLDRFAERQSAHVWHLNREKVLTALAQGRTVTELLHYLQARSSVGLPETVETFLQDLHHQATLLKDKGTARLIECADEHTATLLSSDRKLKGMLKKAGQTWLVFTAADETAVRRVLKELGYVLPPPP